MSENTISTLEPENDDPSVSTSFPEAAASENEFNYRSVPPLAPASLFVGLCSVMSLLVIGAIPVALLGTVFGGVALWQIRRSQGELGGRWLATTGLTVSLLFLLSSSAVHAYVYATEVPEGYERLSFSWLAKHDPIYANGQIELPDEVESLDGKKIYIKGYMYPEGQKKGLAGFVLCKDTGDCCFGGQPKVNDMIVVKFKDGMTVDHREQMLVGVAGTFHTEKVVYGGQLVQLYSLEGTHFR